MLAVEEIRDVSRPIRRYQREPHPGPCRGGGPSLSYSHLAAQSQPIVDRQEDLTAVSSLLLSEQVRLLTLTGPGGVGKTRLAIELGRAVAGDFPDGVVFVDLAPVLDPSRVLDALAASLATEVVPETGDVLERLRAALRERTTLLILDNAEQVLPAASELAELLAAAPGITMLVTSREPLHLRWEQVYHLLPLPLPDLQHLPSLEELALIPSVALFLQRARALNPSFALSENNARAVAELVVRLDGLPLAIELAASRITLMSPNMLLQRLGQRLDLLRWQAQDLPQRQQTLRSAIAWSYDLLSSEEQTLFRHLGVFAGGFSLSAAEAIAGPLGIDAIEGLAPLVDKSLVQAQGPGVGTVRCVLLESMRDYARELLEDAGEREKAERSHAGYYLDLAEQADAQLRGPHQQTWQRRLDAEHDNLRAALRRLLDAGEHEQALRLAAALGYFWWLAGYASEGSLWFEEALNTSPDADPGIRLRALLRLAPLLAARGDVERSTAVLHEALAMAQAHGDRPAIALALTFLGHSLTSAGQVTEGERLLQEALALWQELRDEYYIAYTLAALAGPRLAQGRYQEALELHSAARARLDGIGELTEATQLLFPAALTQVRLGERAAAARLIQEGLKRSLAVQDNWMVSVGARTTLLLVGESAEAGRPARLLGAADALAEATSLKTGLLESVSGLSLSVLRERIERESLQEAYGGGRSLGLENAAALALELLDEFVRTPAGGEVEAKKPAGFSLLSDREQDVLELVAAGLSNKQAAKQLIIAESTVRYHLTSIFNKLGVDTRAHAVAVALQRGLL